MDTQLLIAAGVLEFFSVYYIYMPFYFYICGIYSTLFFC